MALPEITMIVSHITREEIQEFVEKYKNFTYRFTNVYGEDVSTTIFCYQSDLYQVSSDIVGGAKTTMTFTDLSLALDRFIELRKPSIPQ